MNKRIHENTLICVDAYNEAVDALHSTGRIITPKLRLEEVMEVAQSGRRGVGAGTVAQNNGRMLIMSLFPQMPRQKASVAIFLSHDDGDAAVIPALHFVPSHWLVVTLACTTGRPISSNSRIVQAEEAWSVLRDMVHSFSA